MSLKLVFDSRYCTMFDYCGVTVMQSGCAPHNPGDIRVVIDNVDIQGDVSLDLNERFSHAADVTSHTVCRLILSEFSPGDERAQAALKHALALEGFAS